MMCWVLIWRCDCLIVRGGLSTLCVVVVCWWSSLVDCLWYNVVL